MPLSPRYTADTPCRILSLIAAAGALTVIPHSARAAILDEREVALMVESTITDHDAVGVGRTFGLEYQSMFTYQSQYFPGGWSGTMTGMHNGHSVSVRYTGSVTPGGAPGHESYSVSFSRVWNVDGQTGYGSGEATLTPSAARTERDGPAGDGHMIDFGMFDLPDHNNLVDLGPMNWSGSILPTLDDLILYATGTMQNPDPGFSQVHADLRFNRLPKTYVSQLWLLSYPPRLAGLNNGFANMPMFGAGGTNYQYILVPTPGAAVLGCLGSLLAAPWRRERR